jgi:hypothetical protein
MFKPAQKTIEPNSYSLTTTYFFYFVIDNPQKFLLIKIVSGKICLNLGLILPIFMRLLFQQLK